MEKKFIDADLIHDVIAGHFCACCDETEWASNSVWNELRALPAADVISVVRCKDCIHRPKGEVTEEEHGLGIYFPDDVCPCQCPDNWYNYNPKDDFYCAYGQRRELSHKVISSGNCIVCGKELPIGRLFACEDCQKKIQEEQNE